MAALPRLGETAVLRFPFSQIEHLWIAISEVLPSDEVVMVNLTSWKKGSDETCILDRGDHDCVTHKTIVEYRRAILLTQIKLQELIDDGHYFPNKPVTRTLLRQIQDGALDPNGRTPQFIQKIVKSCLVS